MLNRCSANCGERIESRSGTTPWSIIRVSLFEVRIERLTRSASPFFLGGVISNGSLSIKATNALHSSGDSRSCYTSIGGSNQKQQSVHTSITSI